MSHYPISFFFSHIRLIPYVGITVSRYLFPTRLECARVDSSTIMLHSSQRVDHWKVWQSYQPTNHREKSIPGEPKVVEGAAKDIEAQVRGYTLVVPSSRLRCLPRRQAPESHSSCGPRVDPSTNERKRTNER